MSSRSICEFVECEHLKCGCEAFTKPERDCPIAKFGFVQDLEVFTNTHNFESMGEIYECVYKELVPKAVDRSKCFDDIKSDILSNLSDEEQLEMARFLYEQQSS